MGTVFTHYPGMCGVGSNNHFLFLTRSVHPKLEEYLDAYIKAAGIEDDRRAWLFRSAIRKTKKLSAFPMTRKDVWCMVRRRVSDAGIETPIGCYTFRCSALSMETSANWRLPKERNCLTCLRSKAGAAP